MAKDTTLKVHHLRPAPGAKTAKTRVGRGEGRKGKTAGRGTKGTSARYQVPQGFEGCPSCAGSLTRSGCSTRWSTSTGSVSCSRTAAT